MTPWHTLKNKKETKRKEKKEKNRIEKRNEGEEFENIREMKSDKKKCVIQLGRFLFMQVWTEIEK